MKRVTIKLDPVMGYSVHWSAYVDGYEGDVQFFANAEARTAHGAVKRALKNLQRKTDHARKLH